MEDLLLRIFISLLFDERQRTKREKENQEKFYLGIFADLMNVKITHKHNYKLHNTKFLFKITQYIYSYHSCIY